MSSAGSSKSGDSIKAARDYLEAIVGRRFSGNVKKDCAACGGGSSMEKCSSCCGKELWFEEFVLAEVEDIRVEAGRCVCSLLVTSRVRNGYGTLHGGAIALLVDVIGTIALVSLTGLPGGVSTDINISYMSSARLGDRVEVDALVLKTGKTMAVIQVDFRSVPGGVMLAQGRHTKFLQVAAKRESPVPSKL